MPPLRPSYLLIQKSRDIAVNDREALWLAHQRKRWMLPNAELWMRPDAHRWGAAQKEPYFGQQPHEHENVQGLAAALEDLLRLKSELAALKAEIKFRRLLRTIKAFNPNQPRVPAGVSEGGEWTTDGPSTDVNQRNDGIRDGQSTADQRTDRIRVAQLSGTVTDVDGTPYYKPGGHHEMPKGVFEKWELRPETRQVFDKATTGKVPQMFLRATPDGEPQGHFWDGPEGAHFAYNRAVKELSDQFLQTNNVRPENMTPDQARALLKDIRESQDPRIRDFNSTIRLLRRLFPLRTGRGTE
jgi:hypothetical protein